MDEALLEEKNLHPLAAKISCLTGYGLRIGERATLVKSSHERTHGMVIQLHEDEVEKLYQDKSVADYIPVEVSATDANGAMLAATAYILPDSNLSGQNREYAKSLAAVAKKVGLPEEYIREVESWIIKS